MHLRKKSTHYTLTLLIFGTFNLDILHAERGDLISAEEMSTMSQIDAQYVLNAVFGDFAPEAEFGVGLYKLVYETLDGNGEPTNASGVLAFPINPAQAFPVLSYQHGTVVEKDDVTSEIGMSPLIVWMAATGFIFIEADYLGLGISPGLHPYHVMTTYATAVIDLIRAGRQFSDESSDFQMNHELMLAGYSEGGYATLAAQKVMEQEHDEEFEITVSFPMAGAYSLSGVMTDRMLSGESYDQPFYFAYILLSYLIAYPEIGTLEELALPEYADILWDLFDGYHSSGEINAQLPSVPIEILYSEVIQDFEEDDNHPLRDALRLNDLFDWAPQSLTYLFHGEADELVPVENSIIAYDYFIANGSEQVHLELMPPEAGGHADAAFVALPAAYSIGLSLTNPSELGDVNEDSSVDVVDIVIIANIIIGSPADGFELWASNMNMDDSVDILDIITVVNFLLP